MQVGEHPEPEVRSLALRDVHPQDLLHSVPVDADDVVHRTGNHLALVPDLVVHRIQPYDTVDRLQGPVLPGLYLRDDTVGNLAQDSMGDLRIICHL